MKFFYKNGKNKFKSLISSLFYELYCSTIVHLNQMEHMFQDLPFLWHQESTKNHNHFCHFCHGGGTHFLVLAQTLIYILFDSIVVIRRLRFMLKHTGKLLYKMIYEYKHIIKLVCGQKKLHFALKLRKVIVLEIQLILLYHPHLNLTKRNLQYSIPNTV